MFLQEPNFPYQRRAHPHIRTPNQGPHQLNHKSKVNRPFLEHENALCGIWADLEHRMGYDASHAAAESLSFADMLRDHIHQELHRIDLYKEQQWAQQQAKNEGQPLINTGN